MLMSIYHHYLFQKNTPVLTKGVDGNIENKKILLVDDVVHTGSTIRESIKYLGSKKYLKSGLLRCHMYTR